MKWSVWSLCLCFSHRTRKCGVRILRETGWIGEAIWFVHKRSQHEPNRLQFQLTYFSFYRTLVVLLWTTIGNGSKSNLHPKIQTCHTYNSHIIINHYDFLSTSPSLVPPQKTPLLLPPAYSEPVTAVMGRFGRGLAVGLAQVGDRPWWM